LEVWLYPGEHDFVDGAGMEGVFTKNGGGLDLIGGKFADNVATNSVVAIKSAKLEFPRFVSGLAAILRDGSSVFRDSLGELFF
jgi:hypothetical protein